MEGSWKNSELSWGPMLITDPTSVADKANNYNNICSKQNHISGNKDIKGKVYSVRQRPVSSPSRTCAQ